MLFTVYCRRASLEAQREEARETASALRACEVELETVQKKIESQEALKSENYHLVCFCLTLYTAFFFC